MDNNAVDVQKEIELLNAEIKVSDKSKNLPYVFISYKSSDRLIMLRIVHRLNTVYGLRVYYDKEFSVNNELWVTQMEQNMSSALCYGMLVFLTKQYYTSYAACMEMMHSQTASCLTKRHRNEEEYMTLVPVNLEPIPHFTDTELDTDTGLPHNNNSPTTEKEAFLNYYCEISDRLKLNYYKPKRKEYPLTVKSCYGIIRMIYEYANVNENRYYQSTFDSFCNTLAENIHNSVYKTDENGKYLSVFDEEVYQKAISRFRQSGNVSAFAEEATAEKTDIEKAQTKSSENEEPTKSSESEPAVKNQPVVKEVAKTVSDDKIAIGKYVRQTMRSLQESGFVFESKMFNDLFDKAASKRMLSLSYPFFVDSAEKIKDDNGRNRYWNEQFGFNGRTVYITSQWFDFQRPLFDAWYNGLTEKKTDSSDNKTNDSLSVITYTLYGNTYTDNQSNMMLRTFDEVLKRHTNIVPYLPDCYGMNCASSVDYTKPENRTNEMKSYFRICDTFHYPTGSVCVGTAYNIADKMKKIAILLATCNEPESVFTSPDVALPAINQRKITRF